MLLMSIKHEHQTNKRNRQEVSKRCFDKFGVAEAHRAVDRVEIVDFSALHIFKYPETRTMTR